MVNCLRTGPHQAVQMQAVEGPEWHGAALVGLRQGAILLHDNHIQAVLPLARSRQMMPVPFPPTIA